MLSQENGRVGHMSRTQFSNKLIWHDAYRRQVKTVNQVWAILLWLSYCMVEADFEAPAKFRVVSCDCRNWLWRSGG